MTQQTDATEVRVRGDASLEEIAAVLAAITGHTRRAPRETNYERWRRTRLDALRRTTPTR